MCACAQSRLTLCDPMDCNLPGSSVHRIFQTRILEWIAISSSKGSSWTRDQTCVSCIGRWILYHWATWELRYGEMRLAGGLGQILKWLVNQVEEFGFSFEGNKDNVKMTVTSGFPQLGTIGNSHNCLGARWRQCELGSLQFGERYLGSGVEKPFMWCLELWQLQCQPWRQLT